MVHQFGIVRIGKLTKNQKLLLVICQELDPDRNLPVDATGSLD